MYVCVRPVRERRVYRKSKQKFRAHAEKKEHSTKKIAELPDGHYTPAMSAWGLPLRDYPNQTVHHKMVSAEVVNTQLVLFSASKGHWLHKHTLVNE